MPIAILADDVVDRIAAGEAVERPASAVKELIENAIDAAATAVHIETESGGRKLLRVSDNGTGIRRHEIELAFKRHATSKLRHTDELTAIRTLGFRGEALASIAAVSQTTIVTRHRDEKMGLRMQLDAGVLGRQQPVGAPAGSVITIENLFFNTPARLKFLKTDNTEKRHMYWVVARYALAYPQIAFALLNDGRERFRSSGSGQLADVVARVFGLKEFKHMLPVQAAEIPRMGRVAVGVCGYASLPQLHRASRDRIIFFVNGRAVQDSTLTHAVTQAYDGLLGPGAFPLAALMLNVSPDFVDVNVHPTKAEVRFRDQQAVFSAVQRAVRTALQDAAEKAPDVESWAAASVNSTVKDVTGLDASWRHALAEDPFDSYPQESIPERAEAPQQPRTLPPLRVLGQAGAAYIIAEGPAGLYLVDQNAAHERLLYQQLQQDLGNGGVPSQAAAESPSFVLAPEDAALLADTAQIFTQLGFELEIFGPNTFLARSLPAMLCGRAAGDVIAHIVNSLRTSDRNVQCAALALAAAAAIKRGQILQTEEMRALIAKLERCPEPHSAPSGNKTLVHITSEQLSAEFRRA
ncbi:MAG: DNA mismatch repair endonuclease MutL [Chloroflexi bacterium]|nr:DNA mismatch repair endonuclease MutL [Chloroflexota bacterium]